MNCLRSLALASAPSLDFLRLLRRRTFRAQNYKFYIIRLWIVCARSFNGVSALASPEDFPRSLR